MDDPQAPKAEQSLPAAELPLTAKLDFRPAEYARFEALVEQLRKKDRSAGLRRASWESLVLAGLEALLEAESSARESDCGGQRSEERV